LLLSGATMSQQSSLTKSAHSVRQVLTAYTGDDGTSTHERLYGLGLGIAGAGDDQQPERIAGQSLGRARCQHGVDHVDAVLLVQPFAEDVVGRLQPWWRFAGRLGGRLGRRTRAALFAVLGDRAVDGRRDSADAGVPAVVLRGC